jgi:3-methyladenine DNA glycosylase/8-oxoguanine DNA glycosylase
MADFTRARRHLMRQDPKLGALIKEVGPCRLGQAPELPPFVALSYSIASQQLSVKAADTIFNRFCDLFPPDRVPDPARLVSMHPDAIRAVGFSRPKVGFLQDLAAQVVDGRLPLASLHALPDEEVLQTLTAVKGIGRWTAEVFLLFRLGRQDVFPADDLGLVKAVQRVYGLRKKPSRERLMKIAEPWRPYRSVAAWYLWRSLSIL